MKKPESLKKSIGILVLLVTIGLPWACTTNNNSSGPTSPGGGGGGSISTATPTKTSTFLPGTTPTFTPTYPVAPPTWKNNFRTSGAPSQLYFAGSVLLVAETGRYPSIENFTMSGQNAVSLGGANYVITGYPTPGSTPAFQGVTQLLNGPQGFVTLGTSGNVALLDTAPSGAATVYVGSFNSLNLPVTTSGYGAVTLNDPKSITADVPILPTDQQHIFVANTGDGEIDMYLAYGFPGSYPTGYWSGWAPSNLFKKPVAITCDTANNIFVADAGYSPSIISKFGPQGTVFDSAITTVAGCVANGIAVDASDDVYVADTGNNQVEEYSPTGTLLTAWGLPLSSTEFFNFKPSCIAFTGTYILVGDTGNGEVQVFQ